MFKILLDSGKNNSEKDYQRDIFGIFKTAIALKSQFIPKMEMYSVREMKKESADSNNKPLKN